jgi:hypothetical protein
MLRSARGLKACRCSSPHTDDAALAPMLARDGFRSCGTTMAKGGPGKMAKDFVREQPTPTLDLRHNHDGTKNKPVENRMH